MPDDVDRLWADAMPDAYDRLLGPVVFRPFAVDLAHRAATLKPRRVLELAAGTGLVTRELTLALPDAEIIATDLNSAMVTFGAAQVPTAKWEQADAQLLPFPDEWFDLVVCQFGVMFFPDKPAAFAETRRVLTAGGRTVFNTWAAIDTHDFARTLAASLEQAFPSDPPRFVVRIPHGYADPVIVEADLASAGLRCEAADTITLDGTGPAADVAEGFCTGTPLRAEIEARGDLRATTTFIKSQMTARLGTGPVSGSMTAHVFQARAMGRTTAA